MTDSNPKTAPPASTITLAVSTVTLPRITIQFCTQCKWNLRAAYYAQELLQTFGTSLGEVSLVPATGGAFVIRIYHRADMESESNDGSGEELRVAEKVIWDRKVDGGFPETKELKGRVRDVVEPGRGLGHTDRALQKRKKGGKDAQDGGMEAVGGNTSSEGKENGTSESKVECTNCS